MENTMAQIMSVVMLRKQLSNLIDLGPNFDNVFQVFQNSHVIGFTRGLMTHQAPQNVQSSQSSHTVTSQGVIHLWMEIHPIQIEMIRQMTHLQKLSTWRT